MKESKECTNCNEIKPLGEFNKHYRTNDGLSYYCKDCLHIKQKKYYIKPDETVNTVGRVKSYKKDRWRNNYTNYSEENINNCNIALLNMTLILKKNKLIEI